MAQRRGRKIKISVWLHIGLGGHCSPFSNFINLPVIFEKGFVRGVKRKHHEQSNHKCGK